MTKNDLDRPRLLLAAKRTARAGGAELIKRFGSLEDTDICKKGTADYASAADLAAESIIFSRLNEDAPGFGFLGEETGFTRGHHSQYWVIDQLMAPAILSGVSLTLRSVLRSAMTRGKYWALYTIRFGKSALPPSEVKVPAWMVCRFRI